MPEEITLEEYDRLKGEKKPAGEAQPGAITLEEYDRARTSPEPAPQIDTSVAEKLLDLQVHMATQQPYRAAWPVHTVRQIRPEDWDRVWRAEAKLAKQHMTQVQDIKESGWATAGVFLEGAGSSFRNLVGTTGIDTGEMAGGDLQLRAALQQQEKENVFAGIGGGVTRGVFALPYLIGPASAARLVPVLSKVPALANMVGLAVGAAATSEGGVKERGEAALWAAIFGGVAGGLGAVAKGANVVAKQALQARVSSALGSRAFAMYKAVGEAGNEAVRRMVIEGALFATAGDIVHGARKVTGTARPGEERGAAEWIGDAFLGAVLSSLPREARIKAMEEGGATRTEMKAWHEKMGISFEEGAKIIGKEVRGAQEGQGGLQGLPEARGEGAVEAPEVAEGGVAPVEGRGGEQGAAEGAVEPPVGRVEEPVLEGGGEPMPIGVKGEATTAQRAERGLDPVETSARQSRPDIFAKADLEVQADSQRPYQILDSHRKDPRTPTTVEAAILLKHRTELHRTLDKATMDAERAQARGDEMGLREAMDRADATEVKIAESEAIVKRSLEEWGRVGGVVQTMMNRQDYTLESMTATRRRANNMKPLTPEQRAETKAMGAEINRLQRMVERLEKAKRTPPKPRTRPETYGAKNTIFTKDRYEAARNRWKARSSTLSAGLDPTILKDLVEIGGFHFEHGVRKFSAWAQRMVEDTGEDVRDHLPEVWTEMQRRYSTSAKERGMLSRLQKQTEEYIRRVEEGDLEPPVSEPSPVSKKVIEARVRMEEAKGRWEARLLEERRANRTKAQKAAGVITEIPDLVKGFAASTDVSYFGRQALVAHVTRPSIIPKTLEATFRAMASRRGQARVEAEMRADPAYQRFKDGGLEFTKVGEDWSHTEEMVQSRLADKIPIVGHTNRGFVTGMNKVRLEHAKALETAWTRDGVANPAEAKLISNIVNVGTGRGPLWKWADPIVKSLAKFPFWAPRLAVGRFQWLLAQPVWTRLAPYKGTGRVRARAAWEIGKFYAGMYALYNLASLMGGEVEWDSRSSDFGKVVVKKEDDKPGEGTRIDLAGGLAQPVTLIARWFGTKRLGDGKIVKNEWDRELWKFFRKKLAPTASIPLDLITGKTVVGEHTRDTPGQAAKYLGKSLVPLAVRDVAEAMMAHGVPAGAALGLMAIFGAGLYRIEDDKKKGGSRRTKSRR